MRSRTLHFVLHLVFSVKISARILDDNQAYERDRENLIAEELTHTLGGQLQLNKDEEQLNNILMKLKETEVFKPYSTADIFKQSKHFFTYAPHVEYSKIYQIIRRMPKGALLHLHSTLAMDADYLLGLTYEDHLYACYTDDDEIELQFSDRVPQRPCPLNAWTLVSEMRNASSNIQAFDSELKKHFTLVAPQNIYADIHTIWDRFGKVYRATKSLIMYRPVREKYFYDLLKRHYEDNVLYIEMRTGLHKLYELDGRIHDYKYMPKLYQKLTEKFKEKHPDFIGIQLIITRHRAAGLQQVEEALNSARILKKEMPDIIAGFDLVGQEDLGKPLKDYLPALLKYKTDLNYYFHGGETNWFGTPSDENLYDAVLLGTKRIGHAYALLKHPTLMSIVREADIALEMNVISNVVLSLVDDVRNHPLATYLALDLPVVLSSDDPGVWGATPLSHDFYVAFVGVAGAHSDLRMLKQLALNSIKYSALDEHDKARFYEVFDNRWEKFVNLSVNKTGLEIDT